MRARDPRRQAGGLTATSLGSSGARSRHRYNLRPRMSESIHMLQRAYTRIRSRLCRQTARSGGCVPGAAADVVPTHTAVANLRGTSVYSVATPYNTLIVPAAHTALCARGVRSRRAITRPHIGRGRVSPVMAPGPRPRSRTYTASAEYTGPSNVARLTRQGTKPTHHPYWIGVYAVGVFRTFCGLRSSTGRLVCSACESR